MANVINSKQEMINYLISLLSYEHIREDFKKSLEKEDSDFVEYVLNLVDVNTNNILKEIFYDN